MRKSFLKLLLSGAGYMAMGNLLATIMTISLASFARDIFVMGMSVLFAIAIYLLLVAVPAYKDGLEENKRKSHEPVSKYRWALVGVILWGIMLVPSIVFLLGGMGLGAYRLICGAVYPLSLFLVDTSGSEGATSLFAFVPYVFMGFYALTVPACHIGFILGLGDRLSKDKIMYK